MTVNIRKAKLTDTKCVSEIHNMWSLKSLEHDTSRGFLLSTTEPEKIASNINRDDRIFLVGCHEDAIIGYLIATTETEMINSLVWIKDVKNLITNLHHWHILEMAVLPNFAGKGIGKSLYHELFKVTHGSHLSGYVATSPYRNETSIHFHEKMGFEAAATFHAGEFCGLTNYSSTLYFR